MDTSTHLSLNPMAAEYVLCNGQTSQHDDMKDDTKDDTKGDMKDDIKDNKNTNIQNRTTSQDENNEAVLSALFDDVITPHNSTYNYHNNDDVKIYNNMASAENLYNFNQNSNYNTDNNNYINSVNHTASNNNASDDVNSIEGLNYSNYNTITTDFHNDNQDFGNINNDFGYNNNYNTFCNNTINLYCNNVDNNGLANNYNYNTNCITQTFILRVDLTWQGPESQPYY